MRFLLTALLVVIFIMPVQAASKYPDPDRQTFWNNVTDKVYTLGKSPKEAKKIKQLRHFERRKARVKNINDQRNKERIKKYGR